MRPRMVRRFRSTVRAFDHMRPGARAAVLVMAVAIVLGASLLTADSVSGDLTRAAVQEARRSAETLVRGYVDPLVEPGMMARPAHTGSTQVDAQLERLVGAGGLLRIKVWAPDGTVVFSDLPELRGRNLGVAEDLHEALEGETVAEITAPDRDENLFERDLAAQVLEIYLPIRDPGSGAVVGAYEVYQDAAPILAAVGDTRRGVFVIATVMAAAILVLVYLAFAGTWARLLRVNRTLRRVIGEVRLSEARFRSLVQNSRDVVTVLDPSGRVTYESAAVRRVLGYARLGRPLFDSVHPDDVAWVRSIFVDVLEQPGAQRDAEPRVRHVDGSWRVMEWTLSNLLDDSAVRGVILNSRDISERRILEDQLRHQALHDPLTGLANRVLFADRVDHALSRRARGHRGVAVLFVDLDDFKTVNDGLGHGVGDQLLAVMAERLRSVVHPADTVARMGGDEFAILIDRPVTVDAPVAVADRVLHALRLPVEFGPRSVTVSASIGIAWSDGRRTSASDLLRDADAAMYAAKQRGKDRYEAFEAGMREAALARLELRSDFDRALSGGELLLHYQPIADLTDGRILSVEALARWNHPRRGLLTPEWFVPLAEETGQIVALGRWVIGEACAQAARWRRDLGRAIPVTVNLSARELHDPGLVDHLRAALREHDLPPSTFAVEVTERALVDELAASGRTLTQLDALGVELWIDDFGIGYSSLGYLQRLPFDALKIDRSFVAGLSSPGSGEAIVRSIVELGRRLDRTVVAEGIETYGQLDVLRELGCRLGQGHLLARPADARTIARVLRGGVVPVVRPPAPVTVGLPSIDHGTTEAGTARRRRPSVATSVPHGTIGGR